MADIGALIETPMGVIGVELQDGVLRVVDLEPETTRKSWGDLPSAVGEQLRAYFQDGSASIDLPVDLRGTPFQLQVWRALRAIPAGRTVTYGELASKLGTSARAVGGACRANPCPIVIPCHRVVASNGLGGFAGDTSGRRLEAKRWLLRHEGNTEF